MLLVLVFSVCVSCTQNPDYEANAGAEVVVEEPTETPDPAPTETEPTIPQEEPMTKTTESTNETATIVAPAAVTIPTIALAPIPEYPAYILDQCGTLWGIPATLQGEGHKERIEITTDTGTPIPSSELDFFTLDGAIFLTRSYQTTDSTGNHADASDYYRQERGDIEQVESIPPKPEAARVSLSSTKWRIETSIINGVEFSYLYNLDPAMIQEQGSCGGKGARMGAWSEVTGFVELDKGILIMTGDGALFFPVNRACGNEVSEKGRLWK